MISSGFLVVGQQFDRLISLSGLPWGLPFSSSHSRLHSSIYTPAFQRTSSSRGILDVLRPRPVLHRVLAQRRLRLQWSLRVTLEPPFTLPTSNVSGSTFANPFGNTPPPPPPQDLSRVIALVPNQNGLINGSTPFLCGGYDSRNKLPYSKNWTFDMQWQAAERHRVHDWLR